MVDTSEYKVGVILMVSDSAKKGGKTLKVCSINIGSDAPITVVTSAPNVRDGSRVAVALAGSSVVTEEGEEMQVEKTTVGGTLSEGMLCDSRMLGWAGGAAGIAVQIPESIEIGSSPPATKPRPTDGQGDAGATPSGPVTDGLFERKLTKEEKKKLAAEKREARKAAKAAK
eukprot:Nitzschia sp. Nitz4//scaffold267_size26297//15387//15899//NITZ4_008269-RA/size26297-processed-gene-0.29-mRNA-1//-1//CDS//3329544905//1352//frame0